ncbi:MAG: hypothetical protein HC828_03610 [Blastochloris sp.]|nr:hypothetical protein [Blastochloris sp.]
MQITISYVHPHDQAEADARAELRAAAAAIVAIARRAGAILMDIPAAAEPGDDADRLWVAGQDMVNDLFDFADWVRLRERKL